jgi:hypothetical protein
VLADRLSSVEGGVGNEAAGVGVGVLVAVSVVATVVGAGVDVGGVDDGVVAD